MADEETKRCLNDWGFGDLINIFSEQEVTYDCLKSLSTDLIKELIPIVGRRVVFLNRWKKTFETTRGISQRENVIDSATSSSSTETLECSTNPPQSVFNLEARSSTGTENNQPSIHKKRIFTGESEYRKRLKSIDGSYLDDLLNNRSNLAEPLSADFKLNNKLSDKASLMLCECIACDLVVDKHSKFTTQDYIDLSTEIKKQFSTEKCSTYFRPGIPKRLSTDSNSKKPGGRLYDKIKNRKSLFSRLTGTVGWKNQSPHVDESERQTLAEEVVESLTWLDHNRDFTQIDHHWRITAKARYTSLKQTIGNAYDYLTKYPVLKNPDHGHRLINIDFDELYVNSASKFYENWESFVTKVFDLTIKKKKKYTEDVQNLLNIIEDENTDLYAKYFAEILLLPFAIPPRAGVSIVNKSYWKPTTLESQRGFAVHIKDVGDIEKIHEEKVKEMRKKNTTVQPYILGIGNTLNDVNSFIVVLDKPLYRFDSPLTALATCFKIFFTWNVQFPLQSKQIWTLLQHGIFNVKTDTDEIITHVSKLLEFMNSPPEI